MPETNPPESPSMRELSAWMQQLSMQLQDRKQRQVLSIRGDAAWCDTMFPVIKSGHPDALVLSERIAGHRTLAFNRVETLLGSEASMVIVDLFTGLNPDLLCIASGLISCGGLLVLLSPEIEHYSQIEDRYGVWQDNAMSENPVFAEYIFNSIQNMPASGYSLIQGKALPCIADLPQAQPTALISGKTSEQTGILTEINNWLLDRQQSIALIEADRGRGKSTCLGFIVRSLILSQQMSVIVTAHSRQAAAILLQQANEHSKKALVFDFIAPDRLIAEAKHAQVLIIDEAAMLPYPMLQQLCNFYPKVIMATTTGGYEGTGQGFLLRFIARLPDDQLRRFKLNAPVRWASSDCLEAWLDNTLLLKPGPGLVSINAPARISHRPPAGKKCGLASGSFNCRIVNRASLALDLVLLEKIYTLMISAHYRTRPSDLRMLMENPDLFIILAENNNGDLTGLVLLNREGGLPPTLCQQVYLGKRRPKGHLLAQMITAQAGDKTFASYRGIRVQRIAVLENWRRTGVGSALIEAAIRYSREHQFDYIGASFAFDSESAAFWESCQFALVHIGFAAGKSSGNHSVAVLRSLNSVLDDNILQLQARIQKQLPVWLCHFLQQMDAASVIALLRYCHFKSTMTSMEKDEVDAFILGHKGFELCFASLQLFVMQSIAIDSENFEIHQWLIEKAVQNRDWVRLSDSSTPKGRKQMQNKLRELIRGLSLNVSSESN
ncbi:MAG: GNAT family N-acetyltransferase [Gammaproteobacteria bacterium]|nr:GNAT family N-acetyltransferase [Gammaproteobacteria bacterium]